MWGQTQRQHNIDKKCNYNTMVFAQFAWTGVLEHFHTLTLQGHSVHFKSGPSMKYSHILNPELLPSNSSPNLSSKSFEVYQNCI